MAPVGLTVAVIVPIGVVGRNVVGLVWKAASGLSALPWTANPAGGVTVKLATQAVLLCVVVQAGGVAADATVADRPTNEPVASAVASSPAALRRAKDRRPRPPVVSNFELGAEPSDARERLPPPPENLLFVHRGTRRKDPDLQPAQSCNAHKPPPPVPTPVCVGSLVWLCLPRPSAGSNGNHGFPFLSMGGSDLFPARRVPTTPREPRLRAQNQTSEGPTVERVAAGRWPSDPVACIA